jgi:hypothetical protein
MNRTKPRRLTAKQRRVVAQITADCFGRPETVEGADWRSAYAFTARELFKADI